MARLTDYVRALGGEAQRAAAQAHLASGCRRCRHTADLLHKVVAAAAATRRSKSLTTRFGVPAAYPSTALRREKQEAGRGAQEGSTPCIAESRG